MPPGIGESDDPSRSNLCHVVFIRLGRKVVIQDSFVKHSVHPAEVFLFFFCRVLIYHVVVIIHNPLAMVVGRVRHEAGGVAQGNHPMPVGRAHGDADHIQAVVRLRMHRQIILNAFFKLFDGLGILITIVLDRSVLNLYGTAGGQGLSAHAVRAQLINTVVLLTPGQLFEFVAVHFLDIRAILLDERTHINVCSGFIQVRCLTLGVDEVRIFAFGDHHGDIFAAIAS